MAVGLTSFWACFGQQTTVCAPRGGSASHRKFLVDIRGAKLTKLTLDVQICYVLDQS